jgi:glycosyltransferase involved in cell wall biosynthesis
MDVGANAELLGPAHAAHVVPAGDLDAFVRVAAELLGDPERRRLAGLALRERVLERYTLAGMMAAYERVYRATGPGRAAST